MALPEPALHCWAGAVAIKAHCVQQNYVMLSQRTCERTAEYHHMNPIPVKWKRFKLGILALKQFIVKTKFPADYLAESIKSACLWVHGLKEWIRGTSKQRGKCCLGRTGKHNKALLVST